MSLIDYTSFDDVRAALGVSIDELSDTTLSLNLYAFNLVAELRGIDSGLIAYYAPFIAAAPTTDPDLTFYQSVKLFAAYAVAKQACGSLPMFSPKEQTDGKSSLVRFSADPYKVTIARIGEQYDAAKISVADAFNATQNLGAPLVSDRPWLDVVSPDYDPISG